jgi:large subunit ribosomal protein L15
MKYNELTLKKHRQAKRVGRGIAAGQGKTAGRGTKGQGSRVGSTRKPGFEGGQNPLMQRVPKLRGFKSFKVPTENVTTGQIKQISGVVDNVSIFNAGLTSSPYVKVKLIVGGEELDKKVTIKLQAVSANALKMVEKAGGSFVVTERVMQVSKKVDTK